MSVEAIKDAHNILAVFYFFHNKVPRIFGPRGVAVLPRSTQAEYTNNSDRIVVVYNDGRIEVVKDRYGRTGEILRASGYAKPLPEPPK